MIKSVSSECFAVDLIMQLLQAIETSVLGDPIDRAETTNSTFTPKPGIVVEFSTIVNRICPCLPKKHEYRCSRNCSASLVTCGYVILSAMFHSVACGESTPFVATNSYDGPEE